MDYRSSKASEIHLLKQSCRLCLEVLGNETKSLFSDSVQHQIRTCTGISIERDDRLSTLICITCFNQLTESFLFYQKCHHSYDYLQNFLDKCNKIDIDILENSEPTQDYDNLLIVKGDVCKIEKMDDSDDVYEDNPEDTSTNDFTDEMRRHNITMKKSFRNTNIQKNKLLHDTNAKLKPYLNKKENSGSLQCRSCNFIAQSHSTLIMHMKVHNREKPHACASCSKRFSLKSSLDRHMLKAHLQKKIKKVKDNTCEHCGKRFSTGGNLKLHRRIHTGEKPHICSFCEKRFAQMSTLISHVRRHTGEKPYKCKICNKNFIDQTTLNSHQKVHSEEKPFVCDICDKGVKSKNALKQHLKLHTHEKEHICEQCGTSFMTRGSLNAHIRRVHSERSGECIVCKKVFSNLSAHMVSHTGEKPYKCTTCGKSFSHIRGLNIHGQRHMTENKYKCEIDGCHRLFSAKWVLECHMMKHTGNAPHVCKCCFKSFFRICDLTNHMRLNHPNESNYNRKSLNE